MIGSDKDPKQPSTNNLQSTGDTDKIDQNTPKEQVTTSEIEKLSGDVKTEDAEKKSVEPIRDKDATFPVTAVRDEDDEEKQPVEVENSAIEVPKRRVGEILPSDLNKLKSRTETTKLDDTDFEDGDPRWGTARFNNRMVLELRLTDSDGRFSFMYDEIDELHIGRRDPVTGVKPEIDLEPFDGQVKGVSRRHASIVRRDGSLNLLDQGSPNGTFLNGQKLVPKQPRILRDGDDIRFGHLVVRVSFKRAKSSGGLPPS